MSHSSENKNLLNDVLAEATPDEFRAALLGETLRLVRHRRRGRRARRAGAALASVLAIGFIASRVFLSRPTLLSPIASTAIAVPSFTLIRTVPLPASDLIGTQPLGGDTLVASAPGAIIVNTTPGSGFRLINDDELLAFAAPRRAVLVRLGPNSQELIVEPSPEQRN